MYCSACKCLGEPPRGVAGRKQEDHYINTLRNLRGLGSTICEGDSAPHKFFFMTSIFKIFNIPYHTYHRFLQMVVRSSMDFHLLVEMLSHPIFVVKKMQLGNQSHSPSLGLPDWPM